MIVKIRASENFQTMEIDVDVKDFEEASKILAQMRFSILSATQDITKEKNEGKKSKEIAPPIQKLTMNQRNYLINLGCNEEDIKDLSKDEATKMIYKLTGR